MVAATPIIPRMGPTGGVVLAPFILSRWKPVDWVWDVGLSDISLLSVISDRSGRCPPRHIVEADYQVDSLYVWKSSDCWEIVHLLDFSVWLSSGWVEVFPWCWLLGSGIGNAIMSKFWI